MTALLASPSGTLIGFIVVALAILLAVVLTVADRRAHR